MVAGSAKGSDCVKNTAQVFCEGSIQKYVLKIPAHDPDPADRPPSKGFVLIPNPRPNLSGEPGRRMGLLASCGARLLSSLRFKSPIWLRVIRATVSLLRMRALSSLPPFRIMRMNFI